ncbi:MAG: hypothetical protein A3H91_02715 [Gammaproteobacteria bacterium RIFCSPLOWO2_02_FULL_61_13]|nr:MAG: hypothetical protein A3H91_02715 [Gammaproteobacteria bacterium RIFCSPLOWO2_02_FULL_61_13]
MLLLSAQVLDSVHGISHLGKADDQVCSQCLHGRPKQHATLPALEVALSAAGGCELSATLPDFFSPAFRLSPRPRGPPLAG